MKDILEKVKNEDNIIVVIKLNNDYRWFISYWELWIMNYEKFSNLFNPDDNDFSERFDIGLLDRNSISEFLNKIKVDESDSEELRNIIISELPFENDWDEYSHIFPSLFIDFDTKKLYSLFDKEFCYENYLPSEWIGNYEDFFILIPLNERYWIIDDYDTFQAFTTKEF